jgi:hypothetical protein
MGGLLFEAAHLLPTTQSPADRAGQGGGRSLQAAIHLNSNAPFAGEVEFILRVRFAPSSRSFFGRSASRKSGLSFRPESGRKDQIIRRTWAAWTNST